MIMFAMNLVKALPQRTMHSILLICLLARSTNGFIQYQSTPTLRISDVKAMDEIRQHSRLIASAFNRTNEWTDVFTPPSSRTPTAHKSPIPVMPSPLFQQLALSQLELLANSCLVPKTNQPKIKSMALYLPQENAATGQLEFLPAVLYPNPTTARIFIAAGIGAGVAPTLPKTLTTLPGFRHATSLLPAYPMLSSGTASSITIGVVEEVLCNLPDAHEQKQRRGPTRTRYGAAALSVPLLYGLQTVGVLLVSPGVVPHENESSVWTESDREQVARAATSLSLALSMDRQRNELQEQNDRAQQALSDSLHQLKNPLQALRTYGKLLQQRIADTTEAGERTGSPRRSSGSSSMGLLELVEHLMVQSDRVVDRLKPVDHLVDSMGSTTTTTNGLSTLTLGPASNQKNEKDVNSYSLQLGAAALPWEDEALQFARQSSTWLPNPDTRIDSPNTGTTLQRGSSKRIRAKSLIKGASANLKSAHTNAGNVTEDASSNLPTSNQDTRTVTASFIPDMPLEMSFVDEMLDPVLSAFKAIAQDHGISFIVEKDDELPGVMVSPEGLQEIVSNLIDNAIKYVHVPKPSTRKDDFTPPPRVRIQIRSNKPPKDPGVTITVEDNGPGIPTEERDSVFQRGFRGSQTKFIDGSGIGLDIARTLAKRMGGTLSALDNRCVPDSLDGALFEVVLFRKIS